MFGEIFRIYLANERVFLYCRKWYSTYLRQDLNAYAVEEDLSANCILEIDDIIDPKPHSLWKAYGTPNESYICLQHKIYNK